MIEFLPVLLIAVSCARGESPCNSEDCVGPFKIEIPEVPKFDVTWETEPARVVICPDKVWSVVGYRSHYSSYCYEGGDLDGNTGCDASTTMMPPDMGELLSWRSRGQCKVGINSCRDSNYWGSDASLCFHNPPDVWVTEKEFQCPQEKWRMFAHHTCIYDWRCGVKTAEVQVDLVRDANGNVQKVTYDQKGAQIQLKEEGTFVKIDQETSMYVGGVISTSSTIDVHCVHQESKILCQLGDDSFLGPLRRTVVAVEEDLVGTSRNLMVMLLKKRHLEKVPAKAALSAKFQDSWVMDKLDASSHLMAAVSVLDLKPVIHSIMFTNAELNYNTLNLLKTIQNLQQVISEIIKSNGKIDDELVGNIMGTHSRTKWFNKDLFHMCPCFQTQIGRFSNCGSGFRYENGRLTKNMDLTKCSEYSPQSVKSLEIFKTFNFTFTALDIPPARGTSANWDGWSWLSDKKESMLQSFYLSKEVNGGNNGLNYFYGDSYAKVCGWLNFIKTGTFVSYLALGVSLWCFCRK